MAADPLFVQYAQSRSADAGTLAADLERSCRAEIAGYKVPKHIEIRTDPLPKSGPGKILKRALRAPYWQDRDAAIG